MEECDSAVLAQVERILASDSFRSSEGLRRLLKFLTDKTLAGEADRLKEYSVGVEGLGRAPSYDTQRDPSVRIQIGRLRQKLADYYRNEGKDDPVRLELPKGKFRLVFGAQSPVLEPPPETKGESEPSPETKGEIEASVLRRVPVALWPVALVLALAWGSLSTIELWRERRAEKAFGMTLPPAVDQLWRPFLTGVRPTIVSFANPPFAELEPAGGHGDAGFFYGRRDFLRDEDVLNAPELNSVRRTLGAPQFHHTVYYTPIGEISAIFQIGRHLAAHVPSMLLVRSSDLSWQQMADNNIIYAGPPAFFADHLANLPAVLDLRQSPRGIDNSKPNSGEPAILFDQFPAGSTFDGEVYALITRLPGPVAESEVMSFTSNRSPGYVAAVKWFTEQATAQELIRKVAGASGKLPPYYQIVLKTRFRDAIPLSTSYVLFREVKVANPFRQQPAWP
ncbi:MAG: hypothetical protein JO323_26310 [Acidobacteriia bacterium]|nr:hypothetical protein [Terriglobia bacterium]